LRARKAQALQQQRQRLDTLCASVDSVCCYASTCDTSRDAAASDTSVDLQAPEEVASQRLDALTSDISITLQTLETGAVQWLDKFSASMKRGDGTISDTSIRSQTLEEGAFQGIEKLCATMEARDAVVSNILTRLKILEDGAVSREMKFQSDIVTLKEQHFEELVELRNDFNKKHVEELLEIRNKQAKQEESLGAIVTELEQLLPCTKEDLQHEQLNEAWQVKFNELQVWAKRQVESLETECLAPLGTLVRQMHVNMSEHKLCHDSFKEHMQNDLERLKQEKDQLHEEIAPLKIDMSGLGQKVESYMIQAVGWKEHQEKRLSEAESNASNVMVFFEDLHALCAALDAKLESDRIQAAVWKEHQEKRLSQVESNASNMEGVQPLCDKLAGVDPATDPTASSQIDCNPRLQALLQKVRSQEDAVSSWNW
jgi:hypothetical protein